MTNVFIVPIDERTGMVWYQHTVAIDVDDGASPSLVFPLFFPSLVFLLLLMKAIFHQHDLVCFLFSESVILVVVI